MGDLRPNVFVNLTCAVIVLGGAGVIKTWTEVAARVLVYMLTFDPPLVSAQFSHWLQVLYFYYYLDHICSGNHCSAQRWCQLVSDHQGEDFDILAFSYSGQGHVSHPFGHSRAVKPRLIS